MVIGSVSATPACWAAKAMAWSRTAFSCAPAARPSTDSANALRTVFDRRAAAGRQAPVVGQHPARGQRAVGDRATRASGHAHARQRCHREGEGLLRRRGTGARAAGTGEEPVPGALADGAAHARAHDVLQAADEAVALGGADGHELADDRAVAPHDPLGLAQRARLDAEGAGVDAIHGGLAGAAQGALEGARVGRVARDQRAADDEQPGVARRAQHARRAACAGGRVPAGESGPRRRRGRCQRQARHVAGAEHRRRRRDRGCAGGSRADQGDDRRDGRQQCSSDVDARHLHRCNVGNGALLSRASLNYGLGPLRRTSNARARRMAAWLVTGPIGHLYGGAADLTALLARYAVARARGRDPSSAD